MTKQETKKAKAGDSLPEDEKTQESPDSMTTSTGAAPAKRSAVKDEAEFRKTANEMKAMLDKQPKVRIFVPLENGEPKGTQLPVEINGYHMNVPKGVPNVEVPQAVADIIWQSLGIYDEASSALRSENEPNRPLRLDLQDESDRSRLNA